MLSPYKLAGYSAIISLILSFFVAGTALYAQNNDMGSQEYLCYTAIILITVLLTILYYRGFVYLAREIKDRRLLAAALAVFLLTIISLSAQFVYSSMLYIETSRFSMYDALMHENSLYGSSLFYLYLGISAIIFGYALMRASIPYKIAYYSGILLLVSGILLLLGMEMIGSILYLAAGIMLIVLLFRIKSPIDSNDEPQKKENSRPITKPRVAKKTGAGTRKRKKAN